MLFLVCNAKLKDSTDKFCERFKSWYEYTSFDCASFSGAKRKQLTPLQGVGTKLNIQPAVLRTLDTVATFYGVNF